MDMVAKGTDKRVSFPCSAYWLGAGGLAGAWVVLVAAPLIPGLPAKLGTVTATILLTAATFVAIYGLARIQLRTWHEVGATAISGGLWWLISAPEVKGAGRVYLAATANVLFMLACIMFGRLMSRLIREPNLLLPVLITAAVADVFTVSVGPTRLALEKAPKIVRSLSLEVPKAGSAASKEGAQGLAAAASVGLGDFIFATLFLTAAWRYGLDVRRAAAAATILAAAAMAAVLLVPKLPAVPLLPFIVAGVLLPNAKRFKLSQQERMAMAIGGLFLLLLLMAFYAAVR
jgi:hypothetical protein